MIIGNVVGGRPQEKTLIIRTENGKEFPAVFVDSKKQFTATANDIRVGKVAVSDTGVLTGEKIIPAYHTCQGFKVILPNTSMTITNLVTDNSYDYTKIQMIVCRHNTCLADSVAAEMISIDDKVYNVRSVETISNLSKNHNDKSIELGVTNNFDVPVIVRYFTYKEV